MKKRILFVCLGNICRSAAAEAIMKKTAEEAGRAEEFEIDSAGILSYHQGEPADRRMREHCRIHGYDVTSISRPVRATDFDHYDLIVGMDNSNIDDLKDRAQTESHLEKIHAMREYFAPGTPEDHVPDPYYGGAAGFELVISLLEESCANLLKAL